VETIAAGASIREIRILRKKLWCGEVAEKEGHRANKTSKCILCVAEIHWYEAHGIGRVKYKIKRVLNYI